MRVVDEGNRVHEISPVMWLPYLALAIGTLAIGLLAPVVNLKGALESASNTYLASLFPSLSSAAPVPISFNLSAALWTGAFVIVGIGAASVIYMARRVDPAKLAGEKLSCAKSVHFPGE